MKCTFTGEVTTTYADYIDTERQSTLVAEPGETYDIAPARGHVRDLPMPPDERWKPAPKAQTKTKES